MSKNQKGFSLIEVLVAITLLSLIMMGVISVSENSISTSDRVVAEDNTRMQVETAFSRMEWDISQLYSPLYFSHTMQAPTTASIKEKEIFNLINNSFVGNKRFNRLNYDGLPIPINQKTSNNKLILFTTSNRRKTVNIHESNFLWASYFLTNDDKDDSLSGYKLVRQTSANNPFGKEDIAWEDIKEQTLLRNVEKLKFEFWDKAKKQWTDNLATINAEQAILGIKITVEWLEAENTPWVFTRIFRPLFPYYVPENMYQFKNAASSGGSSTGGSGGFGGSGDEEEEEEEEEVDDGP